MKKGSKFISSILLFFYLILSSSAYAQNFFKYPDFDVSREDCDTLLESMNYPNADYTSDEPLKVYVDLLIERIFEINGKEMEFEAFYSMWYDWNDVRLAQTLKDLNLYYDQGKRIYLCSYNPLELWGNSNRLFYPTIEFYNKKTKTNINLGGDADWVDIYSDGNVGTRLRDSSKFSANFDFRRFPFDTQKLTFELWSEYPSTLIEILPEPISMPNYKETKFVIDGTPIQIPGWSISKALAANGTYKRANGSGINSATMGTSNLWTTVTSSNNNSARNVSGNYASANYHGSLDPAGYNFMADSDNQGTRDLWGAFNKIPLKFNDNIYAYLAIGIQNNKKYFIKKPMVYFYRSNGSCIGAANDFMNFEPWTSMDETHITNQFVNDQTEYRNYKNFILPNIYTTD